MAIELKKFVFRGGLFIAALLSVLLFFNFIYIKTVEKRTIYWRNVVEFDRYFQTHKHLDFAFFGTSHTRDSLNPAVIPNSANFSLSGENYVVIYYRLKYLLEKYKLDIDNVVLEIDPITLTKNLFDSGQLANYDYAKFVPFKDIQKLSGLSKINILIRSNFPFIGRGFETYGALRTPPMELYLGWAKELGDYSKNKMDLESVFKNEKGRDYMPDKTSIEYLKKTILLAKDNGMKIYFIKNPHVKEIESLSKKYGIDYGAYYKEVYNSIDSLNVSYVVLDYYSLFDDKPDLFHVDGTHVNYKGSEVLSKKIIKDVNARTDN